MGYIGLGEIRRWPVTVGQGLDDVDKTYSKKDHLEKDIARSILPTKYHPSVYDDKRGFHLREETWLEFVKWRMAGEEDWSVEYVETLPTKIYVIPTEGRDVFYNKGGLKMADAFGIYNFRDAGILAHKAHDLQGHARDFMSSDEGKELAIKHPDLLSKAPNIDYIIIGKDHDAIYGVAQICEHSAILFGNWDSYKMIERWAKREGIEPEDFILRAIGEEYAHLVRRGKATVQEEVDVRLWLIDMYGSLAEKTLDARVKGKYQRMISALEKDLATVKKRYSKRYSKNVQENLVEMYKSDNGKLEMILEAEAIMEQGLSGAAVEEYVASKLEEIAEASEEYLGGGRDSEYSDCAEEGELAEVCAESDGGDGEACAAAEGGEGGGDGGGAE